MLKVNKIEKNYKNFQNKFSDVSESRFSRHLNGLCILFFILPHCTRACWSRRGKVLYSPSDYREDSLGI